MKSEHICRANCEISLRDASGDPEQEVGYVSLKFRNEVEIRTENQNN